MTGGSGIADADCDASRFWSAFSYCDIPLSMQVADLLDLQAQE